MHSAAGKTIGSEPSDDEIVRQIAAGNHSAFELLMRRYNRTLFRTARSIMKEDAEAEDVLQEAYMLAYRAMGNFRGDSKLSTWLMRIVINEAIARSRKGIRRAEIIQLAGDRDWNQDATEENMVDDTSEQPERAVLRAETRLLLEKKIDQLPDAFRTVFVLLALKEMTIQEVAICLDIPESTVRTRFFRARSMLREALMQEVDFAMEEVFSFDGERCDRIVAEVLFRLTHSQSGSA